MKHVSSLTDELVEPAAKHFFSMGASAPRAGALRIFTECEDHAAEHGVPIADSRFAIVLPTQILASCRGAGYAGHDIAERFPRTQQSRIRIGDGSGRRSRGRIRRAAFDAADLLRLAVIQGERPDRKLDTAQSAAARVAELHRGHLLSDRRRAVLTEAIRMNAVVPLEGLEPPT